MAGHVGDLETASRLAQDPNPAARAAALGALRRMGALDTHALVSAMSDLAPVVRRRACELAGRGSGEDDSPGEIVDALVRTVSCDTDPSVVESAAWALGEVGLRDGAEVRALEGVVREHDDPLCREAAVAALGAIGDAAALDTILGALEDKAPVRRRAAIALAAFDGPRVDDALRRCLEDRDWQVRQAAEDLLGRL
jgi:HEAT repeat protein